MATASNRKYNIVHVIDRLHVGGAERVLVTLSNLLHEHGHNVSVVTTVIPGPLAAILNNNIPVIDLHRKWKWNPIKMFRLINIVSHFDVIHVHSRHNLRYLWLAKKIFGLKKQIFYHEHHGYRVNTNATSIENKMFADVVFIAVSERLRNWAIEKAGTNPALTYSLPNTIIKYIPEKVIPLKETSNIIQLVMTGNFVPVKNIEFAIELLAQLNKQANKYHLTIIGSIADVGYHEKVIQLIKNRNQQHNISYITDCANIQPLLYRFDLALHTATSESGPLVLIEYIAQGLPFLTYETGEVTAQVKEDLPLHIMSTFDMSDWADRITLLLQENQTIIRSKMETIFDKYYSAEVYYNKCITIYEECLKQTTN